MPTPLKPLLHATDFERVLKNQSRARSEHFALHHLFARPQRAKLLPNPSDTVQDRPSKGPQGELSTGGIPVSSMPVDDLQNALPEKGACWLGMVVPKRHAKRAVTRSLIKRQVRVALARRLADLPSGMWVVRLRSPFDRQQFCSAASSALKRAVRHELDEMLERACRRSSPRHCDGAGRAAVS
jgi:ribonuclease P protein component